MLMTLEEDRKLWPLLLLLAGMFAVFFTWPEMEDETVRLSALPLWSLLGIVVLTLLGVAYFHRIDHWQDWDWSDRLSFLRDMAIAFIILMTNMNVVVAISAWRGWTYDQFALISLPVVFGLTIYYYVRRKREETPEYRR